MADRRRPPGGRRPPRAPLDDRYYDERRYERHREQDRPSPRAGEPRSPRYSNHRPPPRRKKPPPPRRRGMTVSATIVIALFFGFIIIYMALQAMNFFAPNIEIMTLQLSNMELQQSVQGVIIRYEEVFQADRDGTVVFAAGDLERVREGTLVASIQDIDAVTRSEQEMVQLQMEILGVAGMRHVAPNPQVERINANLVNVMERNMRHHMQSNLSDIYSLLETLTQMTDNRNDWIINEAVSSRVDLSRQHDLSAAQLEMNFSNMYATHSGNMSRLIDGYETIFTPRGRYYLSREDVRTVVDFETIIPGREVLEGDDVFKIVGNAWYVATWMPNDMVDGWSAGQNRVIFLENAQTGRFEQVTMRIDFMNREHRDTYVILRSTRNVMDFLHQRHVNIRITDSVQTGFSVPASAITTRRFYRIPETHIHGIEDYFIIRRHDTVQQSIHVNINARHAGYAYILEETLELNFGDILTPIGIGDMPHLVTDADIRIERGVFRANLNVAEFRRVNIEGEIVEEGVPVLLDPARNPNIRQFDSIVVDAALVREGQVLR